MSLIFWSGGKYILGPRPKGKEKETIFMHLGTMSLSKQGGEELFQGNGENEFIRLINSLILSGRLNELVKQKTRTFREILRWKAGSV